MRTANIVGRIGAANDSGLNPANVWRAFLSNPDLAVAIISVDQDGEFRILEINEAAGPFLRLSANEALGHTVGEASIGEVGSYLTTKLRLCVETRQAQNYERTVDLTDGRVSWTTNLFPVFDEEARVEAIVAMGRILPPHLDTIGIDERNRVLVEGLSSTSPGLIYLYDPRAMRANFVGGQVEQLLGFKTHEIEEMANPLAQLIHTDDLPWVASHIANVVMKPCDNVSVFECRVRQKDGEYRLLSCHNRVLDRAEDGTARTLIGIANDVTHEEELKQEVESLSNRLSSAQMEERRLIAQELHDSAGQYIVAAELALMGVQEGHPELTRNRKVGRALGDVMECLKDAQREIRVLSYLLHPPAIANQGLATVLRSFAIGFGGRAGVTVDVAIDRKVNTVPNRFAIPLLRIFQEALTNVHRHAKASAVIVKLDVTRHAIELSIADDGIGFGKVGDEEVAGVGLAAMRERVKRLGGALDILGDNGTTLTVTLPL